MQLLVVFSRIDTAVLNTLVLESSCACQPSLFLNNNGITKSTSFRLFLHIVKLLPKKVLPFSMPLAISESTHVMPSLTLLLILNPNLFKCVNNHESSF